MEEEIKEKQEIMPIETPTVVEDFPKNEEQQFDSSNIKDSDIVTLRGASDGEDNGRRFKEYNPETSSNNLILKLRMMFTNFHVFREALRTYSLKYGHEMWYKRD
ncbi:hypothetical protein GBA52_020612, partial [Prunus armeniaca]